MQKRQKQQLWQGGLFIILLTVMITCGILMKNTEKNLTLPPIPELLLTRNSAVNASWHYQFTQKLCKNMQIDKQTKINNDCTEMKFEFVQATDAFRDNWFIVVMYLDGGDETKQFAFHYSVNQIYDVVDYYMYSQDISADTQQLQNLIISSLTPNLKQQYYDSTTVEKYGENNVYQHRAFVNNSISNQQYVFTRYFTEKDFENNLNDNNQISFSEKTLMNSTNGTILKYELTQSWLDSNILSNFSLFSDSNNTITPPNYKLNISNSITITLISSEINSTEQYDRGVFLLLKQSNTNTSQFGLFQDNEESTDNENERRRLADSQKFEIPMLNLPLYNSNLKINLDIFNRENEMLQFWLYLQEPSNPKNTFDIFSCEIPRIGENSVTSNDTELNNNTEFYTNQSFSIQLNKKSLISYPIIKLSFQPILYNQITQIYNQNQSDYNLSFTWKAQLNFETKLEIQDNQNIIELNLNVIGTNWILNFNQSYNSLYKKTNSSIELDMKVGNFQCVYSIYKLRELLNQQYFWYYHKYGYYHKSYQVDLYQFPKQSQQTTTYKLIKSDNSIASQISSQFITTTSTECSSTITTCVTSPCGSYLFNSQITPSCSSSFSRGISESCTNKYPLVDQEFMFCNLQFCSKPYVYYDPLTCAPKENLPFYILSDLELTKISINKVQNYQNLSTQAKELIANYSITNPNESMIASSQNIILSNDDINILFQYNLEVQTEMFATNFYNSLSSKGNSFSSLPKSLRTAMFYVWKKYSKISNPSVFLQKFTNYIYEESWANAVALCEKYQSSCSADGMEIIMNLIKFTCTQCEKGSVQADLIGLKDGSGSISNTDFAIANDFMKNLFNKISENQNSIRFGLIQFSTHTSTEISLENTNQDFSQIDRFQQMDGITCTDLGFKASYNMFNSYSEQNRVKFLIILTDGQSNCGDYSLYLNQLKYSGVNILSIGVGSGIDYTELRDYATQSDWVYKVNNFSALEFIETKLQEETCYGRINLNNVNLTDITLLPNSNNYYQVPFDSSLGKTVYIQSQKISDLELFVSTSEKYPNEYASSLSGIVTENNTIAVTLGSNEIQNSNGVIYMTVKNKGTSSVENITLNQLDKPIQIAKCSANCNKCNYLGQQCSDCRTGYVLLNYICIIYQEAKLIRPDEIISESLGAIASIDKTSGAKVAQVFFWLSLSAVVIQVCANASIIIQQNFFQKSKPHNDKIYPQETNIHQQQSNLQISIESYT